MAGIPNTLTVSSAYRPATRAEAAERGMDERTSQESVYARGHAPGGAHFPAGPPGGSNHGPGRALDFNPALSGRALTWLRENAGRYGLETLGSRGGRPYDVPHIQLQGGGRGAAGARPSAQDKRNNGPLMPKTGRRRSIAAAGRRVQQARPAPPPGGWRGIGDIGREARMAPPSPPADIPVARPSPTMPLPPAETPAPVAPVDRPPADIPAPIVPAPFLAPPRAGRADPGWQAERALDIIKDSTAKLTTSAGQAEFNAAGVVAAKALAAAGIPAAMARSLMTKSAYEGAGRRRL